MSAEDRRSADRQKNIDKTSVSIAATASGTLAGFGVAVLTLILALSPKVTKPQALLLLLQILGAAIVFLIVSIDFYVVASWKEEVYERFGTYGSLSYGIGVSLLMVAVALMMVVISPSAPVGYTILALTWIGWVIHYGLRLKYAGPDPHPILRLVTRITMFAIIFCGIVLVYVIERGCF